MAPKPALEFIVGPDVAGFPSRPFQRRLRRIGSCKTTVTRGPLPRGKQGIAGTGRICQSPRKDQ